MTRRRSSTATWEPLAHVRRWDGVAFVGVAFGRRWDGLQWVEWWPVVVGGNDFQAVTDKSGVLGSFACVGSNTCPVVAIVETETVTASPQGGTGTPTYFWEFVSGDSSVTVSNATAATVTFSVAVGRRGLSQSNWRCTITRGSQTAVANVFVSIDYEYTEDGFIP